MKVFYPGTQTGYHILSGKYGINLKPGENDLPEAQAKTAIAAGICRAVTVPRTRYRKRKEEIDEPTVGSSFLGTKEEEN